MLVLGSTDRYCRDARNLQVNRMRSYVSTELMQALVDHARAAGSAILEIYDRDDFSVTTKNDESPLTEADLASHRILMSSLRASMPDVPILSEESEMPAFDERRSWHTYFLIDPLDGTKEFINRNGEFTVNIALIQDGMAVMGVVHVPVTGQTYTGMVASGRRVAHLVDADDQATEIRTRSLRRGTLGVVGSRRHGSEALAAMVTRLQEEFDDVEFLSMGSSLKLCLIAEGKADFYPRVAPTCEWDTAAAQAVVEAAGGCVVDNSLELLRYNQKDDILNPHFFVVGDTDGNWINRIERLLI